MLAESLGVKDLEFKENLRLLYEKWIASSKKMVDSINIEINKNNNNLEYLDNIIQQINNNKQNAVS